MLLHEKQQALIGKVFEYHTRKEDSFQFSIIKKDSKLGYLLEKNREFCPFSPIKVLTLSVSMEKRVQIQ